MALEDYYSGGSGKVTVGTVDFNVTEWEMTIDAKSASVTTTKEYDPTTRRTWTRRILTTMEATGTFSFLYDKGNKPHAKLYPGAIGDASFALNDADNITGKIFVDNVQHKSGGVEGVQACTVKYTSQGPMVLPGDGGAAAGP